MPRRVPSFSTWAILLGTIFVLLEETLNYGQVVRDLIRATEITMVVCIVAITLVIARRYYANFRADPTKARLLPRHIIRLGLGSAGLAVVAGLYLIHLSGEPFLWYVTPVAFPFLAALLAGLVDMILWLPNRTAPPINRQRRMDDFPPSPNDLGKA